MPQLPTLTTRRGHTMVIGTDIKEIAIVATWLGWILFGAMLLWWLNRESFHQRQRLYLRNYIIYLLLQDSIREGHKAKFEEFIRASGLTDAMQLSSAAHDAVQNIANSMGTEGNSTMGAHAMIWQSDAAAELRGNA